MDRPRLLLRTALLLLAAAHAAGPARAHSGARQQAETPPVFKVEKLTERAHCLYGRGGNVGVLATEAGVVVIDDQYESVARGVVQQVSKLSDRPIRFLINTHYHADHTGGNPVFAGIAEIVAHENVRPRLLEFPAVIAATFPGHIASLRREIEGLGDPGDVYRQALEKDVALLTSFVDRASAFRPAEASPPAVTYDGRMTLWLGGSAVEVLHAGPGHTDGDSIVYLRDEKVLHMGDLLWNGMYPFVDVLGGGSIGGWIRNLDRALDLAAPDARVIPGHGPVTDMQGVRRMRAFLSDLMAKVSAAMEKGASRAEAVRSIRMDEYPELKPAFRTLGNLVTAAYDELAPAR
ncbi:MAG TPA: MBL fold metallo-hydrolase [Candidatus Polarisedimenticolia bacterium]|nr:MBL fold metallo-hydrolase [Candidatus Polarisedimenticolia bacterium]